MCETKYCNLIKTLTKEFLILAPRNFKREEDFKRNVYQNMYYIYNKRSNISGTQHKWPSKSFHAAWKVGKII